MGRTTLDERGIEDRSLTGASLREELGIYDETFSYPVGSVIWWKGSLYKALNNITPGIEGILTAAPDIVPDWEVVKSPSWSAFATTVQTFNNIPVVLNINTERKSDPSITLNAGVITFNSDGDFIINYEFTSNTTGNARLTSKAYLEKSTDGGIVWNIVGNTEGWVYNRNSTQGRGSAALSIPIIVLAGDMYRISVVCSTASNITTEPNGCNLSVFALSGTSGPSGAPGPQGIPGAPGDIIWKGTYIPGTYNINEAVEYQGSSYVSIIGTNTDLPTITTSWDLIAQKGANGTGALTIQEEGITVLNGPHDTLNFTGVDVTASDAGAGIANINISPTKNSYMVPILAEENAALANNKLEWAFGNGANTTINNGISILVPVGYSCAITGMSMVLNSGSATIEVIKNGVTTGLNISADVGVGNKSPAQEFGAPVAVVNGDRLNFRTVTAVGTSASNTVTMWLTYQEL